jgi:hypothetical protein
MLLEWSRMIMMKAMKAMEAMIVRTVTVLKNRIVNEGYEPA